MADAIRYSAWRSSWKSAGVPRSSVMRLAVAKASNDARVRSGPRYCPTVLIRSSSVTVVRQRRKFGAAGASCCGTNRSVCRCSIDDGCRTNETMT